MCRRIFKEQTSENGEIPFYKIGTFGGEADAFISRELFEEYKAKYQYPKKGDILISASGSIGRTVVFTGKNEYFQDSNIVWLNHDKHLDNSFLKCFYSIVKWAGIEGSTIKRLYNDNILNTAITLPSVEEQQKIGAYFENLDNLITLHQREFVFLCKEKIEIIRYIKNTWEQRKFDEVFDCTIPNNTLSRAELNYESGSVRNIHYGDILIKYGSVVDVQNDEIPFATGKSSDDFKGALLRDGDIIIADTAEDETTGKACEIGNSQGLDVVSGLHTMVCRPRNKMALGYLGYYLNSDAYHHQLLPLMQGIKVLSLSRTNVQKTMVCYPKSKAEQQLIADCFRNLDNLITLHQRKYDKLTNVKKSMLGKMFPQNGSNVPEIRFKGFTEAWEQRKFSDLVQIERGGSPRPIDDFITDSPDGLNWVKIGDAPAQGNYITKTAEKIKPEGLSKTREVHPGDLILSNSMSFGKPYIMGIDGCIHDGWLLIRNTYKVFDLTFLCHLLGTPQMIIQYKSLAAGSTVNNLNKELVGNTVVTIPTIKEQRVLGQYLETLDNLITLHQRKCQIDGCRFQSPLAITWEQRKFDDITYPAGEKNRDNLPYESYSVTNENGFIPQNEQFENGGTMATADKSMYYIVSKNSFAYNPARINVGSIGYYDKPENVIVSSLYEVFKTSEDIDDRFLWHWFKSDAFQRMIEQYQEGGVRLYFYYDKLCMCSLPVPDIQEQRKIGKQLDILDNLITLHQCE